MILYISEEIDSSYSQVIPFKQETLLDDVAISCTATQSDKDFSLSLELAGYSYIVRIGGIIRVSIGAHPFEFRVEKVSYTESSGTTSVSARYRGYDLNGIYPQAVRGDMMMKTPSDALEAVKNWDMYGGYLDMNWLSQYSDREEDTYVVSNVVCEESGFLMPFYLSQQKSYMDIAYNDIAGAIGYICRPYHMTDFEIVPPPSEPSIEFVHGVNIADITIERSLSDKATGVVSTYKNTTNGQFAIGSTHNLLPGHATLYDCANECDDTYDRYSDISEFAESYFSKVNPYQKGIDIVYTITPTPDVQNLFVHDKVIINLSAIDIYASYNLNYVPEYSIQTISYDCVNGCYNSITVGDKKTDYVDLQISEKAESDRLDSVTYKILGIGSGQWSTDGTYSFTQGSASDIKFAEVSDISDGASTYYDTFYTIRVVGFAGEATKTITLKIDPIPEDNLIVTVKMWKRG